MEGYVMGGLNWFQRGLMLAGGLMMIVPGLTTDFVGVALSGLVLVMKRSIERTWLQCSVTFFSCLIAIQKVIVNIRLPCLRM